MVQPSALCRAVTPRQFTNTGTRQPSRIVRQSDARQQVRRCLVQERKLRQRIGLAVQRGSHNDARQVADLYLKSWSAKVAALVAADRKVRVLERRHRRQLDSQSQPETLPGPLLPSRVLTVARDVNPYQASDERVVLRAQPKRGGGTRLTYSFGLIDRAAQIVLQRVLTEFFEPLPGQFALAGGRRMACAAVMEALEEGSFKWVVQADVVDCYGSLGHDGLKSLLPVPFRVIENTVLGNTLNIVPHEDVTLPQGRQIIRQRSSQRGIPQGSAASPVVSEYALKSLLELIPDHVRLINYSDNVLVLTRTKTEALAIKNLLEAAAQQHPVGPLALAKWSLRRTSDGFRFLGYQFSNRRGLPTARPPDEQVSYRRVLFEAYLLAHFPSEQVIQEVRAWARQFPLWSCSAAFERDWCDRALRNDSRRDDPLFRLADQLCLHNLLERGRYRRNRSRHLYGGR